MRTTSRSGSMRYFPVLFKGKRRSGGARVHPRSAAIQERGRRSRRRREAADGLRLPRADGFVPGRRHADDRADGERIEGRARSVLRRDDRHSRARSRRVETGTADKQNNVLKNAPHTAQQVDRRMNGTAPTRASRPRSRRPWLREHKFWPAVGADRQRLRRPQSRSAPARRWRRSANKRAMWI